MKTIDDVKKEYNELSQKRESYLREANLIAEQMLRLEGQAQLLNEPNEVKEKNEKRNK